MIGRIEGKLLQVSPGEVIVEAAGVGYLVATTLPAYQALSQEQHAALWIHTHVRSDAIILYGFLERDELEAFQRLISVIGVGPRTALAVLSTMTPAELALAVESGDASSLQRTPGVGRKTAERIQLELKGRLHAAGQAVVDQRGDAVSALVNLGYSQRDAQRVVDEVAGRQSPLDLGELLRLALQRLTR